MVLTSDVTEFFYDAAAAAVVWKVAPHTLVATAALLLPKLFTKIASGCCPEIEK